MKVNALKLRQSFGGVLKKLEESDEPIIIEKGRRPVAVLISIQMFNERFIDFQDLQKKNEILARFKANASKVKENSLDILRELRYG